MQISRWWLYLVCALSCFPCALIARADDKPVSFSNDVAPILLTRCQGCHGPDKVKGGYRLDSFERLKSAGSSGAAPVVAAHPEQSALHKLLVTSDVDDRMPKKGDPLPQREIDLIRRWIEQGAAYDGKDPTAAIASLFESRYPAAPLVYPRPVPVSAVAFSPDGKTIAAGGYHEVTLWDTATGELRGRLGNLPRRITSIDFSADGGRLAVAGGEPGTSGDVCLVSVSGTMRLDRIGDTMLTVRFSPDGKRLATGGSDGGIRIYDAATGKRERVIEQHADWVLALAFSPDSKLLASASRDKSARVFDAATGEMRGAFLGHGDVVTGIGWSADGSRCLSAGRDRKLRSWKPEDGKDDAEKKESKAKDLPAIPLALATLGDDVCVACDDGIVRAYRGAQFGDGREWSKLDDWAESIAIGAAKRQAVGGSHSGEVRVWHIADGKEAVSFLAAPGYSPARAQAK